MKQVARKQCSSGTLSTRARWTLIGSAVIIMCSCRSNQEPIGVAEVNPSSTLLAGSVPAALMIGEQTSVSDSSEGSQTGSVGTFVSGAVMTTVATDGPSVADESPQVTTQVVHEVVADKTSASDVACGCRTLSPHTCDVTRRSPDEYICDGGDAEYAAKVNEEWVVSGVELEDTIAHFDTLDGRVMVQPSNRVCIYSPRFAAVRKVTGVAQHDRKLIMSGVENGVQLGNVTEAGIASTVQQPVGTERQVGTFTANSLDELQQGRQVDNAIRSHQYWHGILPHENLSMIQRGIYDAAESAQLEVLTSAARAWTENQAVQVVIDGQVAQVQATAFQVQDIFRYDTPPGKPRLQLVKIASAADAQPGQMVDFTLRFDNVGDQRIGNVTLIDNLTARLEYVPDSAQCSKEANFSTEGNEGQSLQLRWEIVEPLKPGEGGIIRFRCLVR